MSEVVYLHQLFRRTFQLHDTEERSRRKEVNKTRKTITKPIVLKFKISDFSLTLKHWEYEDCQGHAATARQESSDSVVPPQHQDCLPAPVNQV